MTVLTRTAARAPYKRRIVPDTYSKEWLGVEFAHIQRAMPVDGIRTETTSTTALATDRLLLMNATSAALTVTLPDPVRAQFMALTVKKLDVSAHHVTLTPESGTIDGASTLALTAQYQHVTVVSDGAAWWVIA